MWLIQKAIWQYSFKKIPTESYLVILLVDTVEKNLLVFQGGRLKDSH